MYRFTIVMLLSAACTLVGAYGINGVKGIEIAIGSLGIFGLLIAPIIR